MNSRTDASVPTLRRSESSHPMQSATLHPPRRANTFIGDRLFEREDDEILLEDENSTGWSVIVSESKVESSNAISSRFRLKRGHKSDKSLVLYVNTPTASLTLFRTLNQVTILDNKLKETIPDSKFPDRPSLLSTTSVPPSHSPPRKKTVLATTFSRFSPKRLSSSSLFEERVQSPTPSSTSEPASSATPFTELAGYLAMLSKEGAMRQHGAWKVFFTAGAEDQESQHLEKRIRAASICAVQEPAKPQDPPRHATAPPGLTMSPSAESLQRHIIEDSGLGLDLFSDGPVSMDFGSPIICETPPPTGSILEDHLRTSSPSPLRAEAVVRQASDDTEPDSITSNISDSQLLSQVDTAASSPPESSTPSIPTRKVGRRRKHKTTVDDFEFIKTLGKGCAGKVFLVRHKVDQELYAIKALNKRHVLAHRELQHTLTEQSVLSYMSRNHSSPFIIKMYHAFTNDTHLFLCMDFVKGGDLATQLARRTRLGRDRARFYTAEILEGLDALHQAGVIYRDLKPENVLIDREGHVVLTDFGLSKQFDRSGSYSTTTSAGNASGNLLPPWMSSSDSANRRASANLVLDAEHTSTFCGTAEYLAPEVIMGLPYSYPIDIFSLGTMLYEMILGQTPFFVEGNHLEMYRRILHEPLVFDAADTQYMENSTMSLIRGMLQKDPTLRMNIARIRRHAYFEMVDWDLVLQKRYKSPYIPPLSDDETDTQNFDDVFLSMDTNLNDSDANSASNEDAIANAARQGRQPDSEFDEQGNDVFSNYAYSAPQDDASIMDGGDIETEEPDQAIVDEDPTIEQEEQVEELESTTEHPGIHVEPSQGDDNDSMQHSVISTTESVPMQMSISAHELDPIIEASPREDAIPPTIIEPDTVKEMMEEEWDMLEDASQDAANYGKQHTRFPRAIVDNYRMQVSVGAKALRSVANRSPLGRRSSNTPRQFIFRSDSNRSFSSLFTSNASSMATSPSSESPSFGVSVEDAPGKARKRSNFLRTASEGLSIRAGRKQSRDK